MFCKVPHIVKPRIGIKQMKHFCDPAVYPDRHFDGWGMGGQNMCDVHLILNRLVALRYDNLLQPGQT
jgi:hypothetical protein